MLTEALGVFACILILALVGMGPALRLLSSGEKRVVYALGIAPTLGLAMVGLIGFPLVRYVAPVRVWAWPFAAFWAVVSLAVVAWDWRRDRDAYRPLANGRAVLLVLAFVLVCYAVLVSPLIIGGIQYAIFRSNHNDAFFYMSLAETVRIVDWKTIVGGVELSGSNWEGIKALAQASPTALYAVRPIGKPLALANPIAFSWAAQVMGIPVHRFYYAYHLLCFALALPLSLVIGDRLGLSRGLKYLAAAAVILGFWARFVLETDAGYEISTISQFLLVVFAWMQLEQEALRPMSRSRLLLAVACAAMVAYYSVLAVVIVVAMICYYGLGLWQRVKTASSFLYHGLTALLVILIFLLSGQLDYMVKHVLFVVFAVPGEARYAPTVLSLIRFDGTAALWGLPPSIIFESFPMIARVPLRIVSDAIGIGLTAVFIVMASVVAVRRSAPNAERIALAMLAGAFGLSLVLVFVDNARAAGKALTYVYPWLIFGVVLYPRYMHSHLTGPQQKLAVALLSVWLVGQCLLGLYLPNGRARDNILGEADRRKSEGYDVSAIEEYLEKAPPELLLVYVPRSKDWMFTYYSMFVFARYPSYFQSGIIIDNSTEFQNLWFESLTAVPDYAVTLKNVDYIGPENLGTKVAETADLALYRMTVDDVAPFVAKEKLFKKEEAAKPLFPTLKTD